MAFAVQLCFFADSEQEGTVLLEELPPKIVQILLEYEDLFMEPTELPPVRVCGHKIPLMQGAQPVNIRQYRHKLELKT